MRSNQENIPKSNDLEFDNVKAIKDLLKLPERLAVSSSNIHSVRFIPGLNECGTLEVEFKTGNLYHFESVPFDVYLDFLKSNSLGRYFIRNIRNVYNFKKIK